MKRNEKVYCDDCYYRYRFICLNKKRYPPTNVYLDCEHWKSRKTWKTLILIAQVFAVIFAAIAFNVYLFGYIMIVMRYFK